MTVDELGDYLIIWNLSKTALCCGAIYGLKKVYDILNYTYNLIIELKNYPYDNKIKTTKFVEIIVLLANKASASPGLRDKIHAFMNSYGENVEITEQNIVNAVLCISWYAAYIQALLKSDNTPKLTGEFYYKIISILKKIVDFLKLSNPNSIKIEASGSHGVVFRVDNRFYKLTDINSMSNCFIRDKLIGDNSRQKIARILANDDNKYIVLYSNNKLNSDEAGVLQLDYQKPVKMKTNKDLLNCIRDLCKGILYLHNNGLVYRDVKLSNTIITNISEENGKIPCWFKNY